VSQTAAVLEGKSYFNFINSLKSEFTKKNYQCALSRFLNHYKITTETLAKTSPKEIENLLIDYIVRLKQNKKSTSALSITISSITHFCVMNDINIMTKKIAKFKGEHETERNKDNAYSHEEIQTLVNSAPLRLKVIFLVMASTGIRIGALPILRISDIKKTKGLHQFIIYSNSPNQRYITYCTPECAKAIDEYLAYRKRFGEKITPDSYLIRKDFDIHDIEQIRKKSEPIAYDTISHCPEPVNENRCKVPIPVRFA
jgi:integrase